MQPQPLSMKKQWYKFDSNYYDCYYYHHYFYYCTIINTTITSPSRETATQGVVRLDGAPDRSAIGGSRDPAAVAFTELMRYMCVYIYIYIYMYIYIYVYIYIYMLLLYIYIYIYTYIYIYIYICICATYLPTHGRSARCSQGPVGPYQTERNMH